MNTAIKYIVTMLAIALVIGASFREGVLSSIYTTIPILFPVTYLSHILAFGYDVQENYVRLFRESNHPCAHGQPAALAAAVWLSGVFATWLINDGLGAFDMVSISLVTLAGYFLDKRKNHTAYKALACKIAALVGKSHD